MPAPDPITVETPYGEFNFNQIEDTGLSAPGPTTPLRVFDEVVVQISGNATALVCQVQRSTRDPGVGANWAPAGAPITGNPAAGIQIRRYMEPTRGWWRVNIISISGGSVGVVLSGQKA